MFTIKNIPAAIRAGINKIKMSLTVENTPGLVPGMKAEGKNLAEQKTEYRVKKDAPPFRYKGQIVDDKTGVLKPTPTGMTRQELLGRGLIEPVPVKEK
jgi:hypothetical protein